MPSSRSTRRVKKTLLAGALLAAALAPCIAGAALGEPENSVQNDVAQLHGTFRTGDRPNYRLHEIHLPSGTVLREFVTAEGRVFAVSWSGPTIPNLRRALGRYFDDYVTAAKTSHAGHHRLQIHRDDLVIEAGGHMRAFSGTAYLPAVLPAGVLVGDLR